MPIHGLPAYPLKILMNGKIHLSVSSILTKLRQKLHLSSILKNQKEYFYLGNEIQV